MLVETSEGFKGSFLLWPGFPRDLTRFLMASYIVKILKPPGVETTKHLWVADTTAHLSSWAKRFLCLYLYCFYSYTLSLVPQCTAGQSSATAPRELPLGQWGLLLGSPKTASASGWKNPVFPVSPEKHSCSYHLGVHHWNICSLEVSSL